MKTNIAERLEAKREDVSNLEERHAKLHAQAAQLEIDQFKVCQHQEFSLTLSSLEIFLTDVVWTYGTFEYDFEINHRFTKYLKKIYRLGSDEHYSFKYFTKSALVTKI